MVISYGAWSLGLESKSPGRLLELIEHAPVLGLDTSLLGGSELWRNDEVGEVDEGLADALEALLEFGGLLGGGGSGCRLGPD
jgi:hypothetical protein